MGCFSGVGSGQAKQRIRSLHRRGFVYGGKSSTAISNTRALCVKHFIRTNEPSHSFVRPTRHEFWAHRRTQAAVLLPSHIETLTAALYLGRWLASSNATSQQSVLFSVLFRVGLLFTTLPTTASSPAKTVNRTQEAKHR